jgi:excisionase family DNA binding protein
MTLMSFRKKGVPLLSGPRAVVQRRDARFLGLGSTFLHGPVMFALTSPTPIEYQANRPGRAPEHEELSRGSTAAAMHNLMTVKETAEYLRIPLPTVYYLVQRGQLPAIQIGGRWRVKRDALDRDVLHNNEQGQPTVLVVDDDETMQSMFKLFLKKAGFSRLVVGSGKEALVALNKQKFDLCFLDLQLPDITGDEIYKVAKDKYPELPVVIITGYPDSEMMNNILKFGPVTMLKKPLKVEDLEETLRHLGHKVSAKAAA